MYKIFKIVAAALGLIGVVLLGRVMLAGDKPLQDDYVAEAGNSALVDGLFNPFAIVIYVVLGLILALVVFFIFKNLFSGGANLKNTLIGVGAFGAVLLIAYLMSGGDTNEYFYNDVQATEGESQLVGGGLLAFYALSVIAIGAMVFSGIKKMFK